MLVITWAYFSVHSRALVMNCSRDSVQPPNPYCLAAAGLSGLDKVNIPTPSSAVWKSRQTAQITRHKLIPGW